MAIAAGTVLKGAHHGDTYTLAAVIGEGGEGQVFRVKERPNHVAKIYKKPADNKTAAKLECLIKAQSSHLKAFSAWPEERLIKDGATAGFLMPSITGAVPLHELLTPSSREKAMPNASCAFLVAVATNLAKAITCYHKANFIVGDLNSRNILVRPDATVRFIDTDSVQIGDGTVYPCPVGVADYLAPELQGKTFNQAPRTKSSDAFAYGIMAYQLICAGRHPFDIDVDINRGEAIKLYRHALQVNASVRSPLALLGIQEKQILTTDVQKQLQLCFAKRPAGINRPSLEKFVSVFEAMQATVQCCHNNPRHHYPAHELECPWCASEKSGRPELFGKTIFKPKPIAQQAPVPLPQPVPHIATPQLLRVIVAAPAPSKPAWKDWTRWAARGVWDFTVQVFIPALLGLVVNLIVPNAIRFGLWLLPRDIWHRIFGTVVIIATLYSALSIATYGIPNPFQEPSAVEHSETIVPETASP